MSADKTGGAAFPSKDMPYSRDDEKGITMRDYFAAKAMQGICARVHWSYSGAAKDAYEYADAMLEVRK
jgi:hypothetical protein